MFKPVPDWRRGAVAGMMISDLKSRISRAELPAEAGVPALGAAAAQKSNLPAELSRIIRPEVQARWLLPNLSVITPQYIETILRGALVGNHVFQWQLFDLMEDTWPRLVKNLNEVKRAAIRELTSHWRIEPWCEKDEAATPEAQERADLVEEAILGMNGDPARNENGLEETLYDLLDAWGKGTSLLELEWEQRASGAMAPKSSYWVHPKNYAWDGEGVLGLVLPKDDGSPGGRPPMPPWVRTDLRMNEGDLVPIVPDKFLVAICRARSGHPLGGALLRPLAWWWCASNFAADWLMNYAQIFGLPIRWANYASTAPPDTITKICDMLANLGSAGWAAFPEGTKLDLKEPSGGSEHMPQATLIDRCDKQCDLLVLGQTLTTEVRHEGGSRALGEVHADVKHEVVDAAASFLATILNRQAIPSVLRLNYDDGSNGQPDMCPRFVRNEEDSPETMKANAEVLQIAVQAGIPVPVSYALEMLNIPQAEEGEKLVELPPSGGATALPPSGGATNGNDGQAGMEASASDVTNKVIENVLEDLTGVQAKWLGGVKPFFAELVAKAKDSKLSDADFVRALEKASKQMPELFKKINAQAVSTALEESMSSALVNGAVRGSWRRATARMRKGGAK